MEFALSQDEVVESPDVHFDPIVKLAPVETKTLEEDEEEVFKMYVYNCLYDCDLSLQLFMLTWNVMKVKTINNSHYPQLKDIAVTSIPPSLV